MRTKEKNRKPASEKGKYRILMEAHPILFARNRLPMNETCMCWGIEAGEGWYAHLRDLCDILETLNLTICKKFGIVIRAEQVKEKYGTLRFYYFITFIPSIWRRILAAPFDFLEWCFSTKFKSETVENRLVWHPRWRHAVCSFFTSVSTAIRCGRRGKCETVTGAVQYMVDNLIENAESECYNTCEDCGRQIGTEWSPRCETHGWINYLCRECATKRNVTFGFTDPKTGERKYFNGEDDITETYGKDDKKDGEP